MGEVRKPCLPKTESVYLLKLPERPYKLNLSRIFNVHKTDLTMAPIVRSVFERPHRPLDLNLSQIEGSPHLLQWQKS